MSKPDYGLVVSALARVIDAAKAEVVDDDQVVLETLSRFVGGFDFRRMIPASNSVEFNLDNAGRKVETDALVADRPADPEDGLVPTSAVVPTKKEKITIYWPQAEECLKEAFSKTRGGVQFVFVGPGFWEYLKVTNLLKDGKIGSARVVSRPKQPDRDVFLIGHLSGAVTSLADIPRESLARITVITRHPSLLQQMPQVGGKTGPGTWRLMTVQEQREYLAEMPEAERDVSLADALQGVRDSTAKSTLRNLFPEMSEENLVAWFYRTIRRLRPCSIPTEQSARMGALSPSEEISEEEFQKRMKEHAEKISRKPPLPIPKDRKLTLEELQHWAGDSHPDQPPSMTRAAGQYGRVVATMDKPAVHPPTTVKSNRDDDET